MLEKNTLCFKLKTNALVRKNGDKHAMLEDGGKHIVLTNGNISTALEKRHTLPENRDNDTVLKKNALC